MYLSRKIGADKKKLKSSCPFIPFTRDLKSNATRELSFGVRI